MCGRFVVSYTLEQLKEFLSTTYSIFDFDEEYEPRYNVAPSQNVLSIIYDGNNYRVGSLRWGFVPAFAKDEKSGFKMINARSETVIEKKAFRNSFYNNRCVILSDGFYEWDKLGGTKKPMLIQMKNKKLFTYAGLYSTFIKEDGTVLYTTTILTTKANDVVKDIHDRMPVILNQDSMKIWLDPKIKDTELLTSFLTPFDSNKMMKIQVSTKVNKIINNSKDLMDEVIEYTLF